MNNNILRDNIDALHTTKLGIERIKKNLKIDNDDVVLYCKKIILNKNAKIYVNGKNWYVELDNIRITINKYNYSIITAHINKKINNLIFDI